ncbi:hypothetical protein E2320_015917, partial [Naja naja]
MVPEVSSPYPMKLGLSNKPAFNFGVPLPPRPPAMCPDVIQTQQRLEQTSSSLASTLEAAEKEIIAEEADSCYGTTHSAKNILEDISNMFNDLAEQLDAISKSAYKLIIKLTDKNLEDKSQAMAVLPYCTSEMIFFECPSTFEGFYCLKGFTRRVKAPFIARKPSADGTQKAQFFLFSVMNHKRQVLISLEIKRGRENNYTFHTLLTGKARFFPTVDKTVKKIKDMYIFLK